MLHPDVVRQSIRGRTAFAALVRDSPGNELVAAKKSPTPVTRSLESNAVLLIDGNVGITRNSNNAFSQVPPDVLVEGLMYSTHSSELILDGQFLTTRVVFPSLLPCAEVGERG
eukprot:scpid71576/ scgid32670/ 